MGIFKIGDELHEEVRKVSSVMVRSINAQAEYWIKIGMLAAANPSMSFSQIMNEQLVFPQKSETGDYFPYIGTTISFNKIINQLNELGVKVDFQQVPAKDFAQAFPGAYELAQMFARFEAYGYFGGDVEHNRKLSASLMGDQAPVTFIDWAADNLVTQSRNTKAAKK